MSPQVTPRNHGHDFRGLNAPAEIQFKPLRTAVALMAALGLAFSLPVLAPGAGQFLSEHLPAGAGPMLLVYGGIGLLFGAALRNGRRRKSRRAIRWE